MMHRIVFKAPGPPLSENQSRRMHWAAVNRQLKAWKMSAHAAAVAAQELSAGPERLGKSTVLVYLPFTTHRRRDAHNYTGTVVKAIIDGLVSAEVWEDDNTNFVTVLDSVLYVTDTATVFVEIEELR
jgi:Holliday junction resolvase RusA-like endonuclease